MTTKKPVKINIRGNKVIVIDDFYRYKMEEVQLISQKQKTVFENINNICKDLGRDIAHLLKYLKNYFGIAIEYKNDTALTTKNLAKDDVQNAIYKYIDEFVLCRKCFNPETILTDKKKKIIMTCNACSFTGEL